MVSQLALMAAMASVSFLGAIGQLAMKKASGATIGFGLIWNMWLWLFVACYGIGVIVNFLVYRAGGKVSIVFPIVSLSYVFGALLAAKYLGEPVTGWSWAGIVFIIAGVSLIGWGAA